MSEKRKTTRHITGKLAHRPDELMSTFLESGSVPFCAVDAAGRFVVFNHACERISGFTFDEVRRQPFFSLIDPSEHDRVRELWSQRDTRDIPVRELDLLWRTKGGEQRLIHWSFSRFEDALGNLEFSAGVGQDITERHRTQEALRQSEARYAALFTGTSAVMFLTDPETGRFVDVNPACAAFYGYTVEQLRQMCVWHINMVGKEGALVAMDKARRGTGTRFEFIHRLANGELRDVEVYSGPITVNGRVLLHSVVHDISERKRAELSLRTSEDLNQRILEAVPGGIVEVALDGAIRVANAAAQRILGLSWDELSRRFVNDWVPDTINEDGSPCRLEDYPVVRCLATGQAQPAKMIGLKQRDGGLHWAVFSAVPLTDPATGKLRGSVVTFLDVTSRMKAEEALRISEARYRLLVSEASDAICFAEADGSNIDANTKACEMFGYSRDEFRKLNISNTVPPEDRALIGERFGKMKQGLAQRWERELLRKDGTRFPVEISARFLPDGRLMAIMRDTTERKRAEEALRESEQRFRQLADAAPVFIWLADARGHRTYFSRGWLEFTGRALDDEMSDGWWSGLHADDTQHVMDSLAEAHFARQDFSLEYRLRTSDGEYRWVLDHGVPRFAERGQFAGYIGSALDITERKRAESALAESEHNYRLLMEQASDGILVLDAGGRFLDANKRACELLDYTKAQLLTMPIAELLPQDARHLIATRFRQLDAGEIVSIERDMLRRTGKTLLAEISARKIAPARYLAIFRDISERRAAEQALRESQRRLSTLLSNLPGLAYRCRNDADWTMEFVSEGSRAVTGYAPIDFISGKVSYGNQVIHPEDRARVWNEVQAALAMKAGFTLNYRILGADGELRWAWEQGRGVFAESGELVAIEGFISDVTSRREMEAALQQSDERYRAFIAQSSEGIWRFEFDPPVPLELEVDVQVDRILADGRIAECNDVMARMYGCQKAGEMLGKRIIDLLDPSDSGNRDQFRDFARKGYRRQDMESHEIGKDGKKHTFINNVIPFIVDGRLVRIWGTQRDITDKKLAETALQESEERYKRLSGATAEAILIHDKGALIDANQRASQMFGYSHAELMQLSAFMLAAPHSRDLVINSVRAGIETSYEAVGLRKDGSTFPGEITPRNLHLQGRTVRVVAIRDITERKRSEEALRHEAAVIRLMQRAAVAANESAGVSEAIRECLDAVCAHTNWPVGHAFLFDAKSGSLVPSGLWHLDDPDRFTAFRRVTEATRYAPGVGLPGRVLVSGKPLWLTDVTTDPNFPRAKLEPSIGLRAGFGFPVLVGREVVAVLEFYSPDAAQPDLQLLEIMANIGTQLGRVVERRRINDLLENRVAERTSQLEGANRELSRRAIELESINRELESFSYSVSHDLRAPLRGIFGFSQALQEDYEGKLDDGGRGLLERIKSASQRMARLIDDLLGLSRVTRAEMVREPVDLSAMAAEVCTELRRSYPNRHVEVEVTPGIKAVGDPRMLRILLQNLLDNAFKFTSRKDRARITFSSELTDQGVAYCVSDNGAGFEMQYAEKLFGAFQRLHSMKEFEGTGIGLATVQRIVHRHGGRVRAKGKLGEGASVQFTLSPKES